MQNMAFLIVPTYIGNELLNKQKKILNIHLQVDKLQHY